MRRWLLFGMGLAVIQALGLLPVLLLALPGDHINQESFEQIREGMTLVEVEAILGGPEGDFTGGRKTYHRRLTFYAPFEGQITGWDLRTSLPKQQVWIGEEAAILIWLDETNKVTSKECWPSVEAQAGFFDRLCRWLPWSSSSGGSPPGRLLLAGHVIS